MTEETKEGPTPNGGVKSIAYYTDAQDLPVPKERASKVIIVEYDSSGKAIARTYGTLRK